MPHGCRPRSCPGRAIASADGGEAAAPCAKQPSRRRPRRGDSQLLPGQRRPREVDAMRSRAIPIVWDGVKAHRTGAIGVSPRQSPQGDVAGLSRRSPARRALSAR
jgi:hypothetical protein